MMKKMVSMMFVLGLVCLAFAGGAAAAQPEIWDGTVATAFAGGSGTEEDPYLIGNGGQLALIAQYPRANFKLISDICLNDTTGWENWTAEKGPANVWGPIPYVNNGTFDGDGYTIYGLYTDAEKPNQGLFEQLQYKFCLKNLNIDKSRIFGTENVGAFAGGFSGLQIINCVNRADVIATGIGCGGITGNSWGGAIEGCINHGTIHSSNYAVGGITGQSTGTIVNSINYGDVTSTMDVRPEGEGATMQVGGVVGDIWGEALVTDCRNYGTISSRKAAGGVVGITGGGATVRNCINNGAITAVVSGENERSGEMAAGITAGLIGGTVSDCINYGTVSGLKYVGGICAIQDYNDHRRDGRIANCTNRGEVSASESNAGGIVALIHPGGNTDTVEMCVNRGAVSVSTGDGGYYAGGVVGYVETRDGGRAIIHNCHNTAAVTGNWLVGGLVGQLWVNTDRSGSILLETGYNTGKVTGTRMTGGVVGRIGARSTDGEITVRNCYTLSAVATEAVDKWGGPGAEIVTNVKALTATQMGQASSFVGFDFDAVWHSAGDGSYPTLLTAKGSGALGDVAEFTVYQSGRVVVTAKETLTESVHVLAASYQDNRMVQYAMIQLHPGQSAEMRLKELGDKVKLFVLSGQYLPECTAEKI